MAVGAATVFMAWVGFVLSVTATILSVYVPFHEDTPVLRPKPPQYVSDAHVQPERRTSARSSRPNLANTTTASTRISADAQSIVERNTPLRSCSWDTPTGTPFFDETFSSKPKPSFVVFRPATLDAESVREHSISSNGGALLELPAASPRSHSFCITAFKYRFDKEHRTILPRSASMGCLSPQASSTATTSKRPFLMMRRSKPLQKVAMTGRSKSSQARKTTLPPRTRPYEAPYFFPQPGPGARAATA